jgi:TonB family protein
MNRIFASSLLVSSLLLSAATAAVAVTPATDAHTATQVRPISTGYTAPQIVRTAKIEVPSAVSAQTPKNAEVVLKLTVDKNGMAQNVQVVKSASPFLDEPVLEAVQQFRWQPATLDNQAVPFDVTLNIEVQR